VERQAAYTLKLDADMWQVCEVMLHMCVCVVQYVCIHVCACMQICEYVYMWQACEVMFVVHVYVYIILLLLLSFERRCCTCVCIYRLAR